MNVLKLITFLLLTILPIAVLVRDWKFHDRRTRKHHNITRTIIVFWCIGSLAATIFVWLNSAQIEELVNGKNTLIAQNRELSGKLDKYQKDLNEKEQEIKELKAKAQDAKRGITENFFANGTRRRTDGGTISLDKELKETFERIKNLAEDNRNSELVTLCRDQIGNNPDWPTPYLFLGVALANSGEKDEAVKQLEYFLEIAPTLSSYGYEDYRRQAIEFTKILNKQMRNKANSADAKSSAAD